MEPHRPIYRSRFYPGKTCAAVKRFKARVRDIIKRSNGPSMTFRIEALRNEDGIPFPTPSLQCVIARSAVQATWRSRPTCDCFVVPPRDDTRNEKGIYALFLKRYVSGWLNYFGYSRSYVELVELDQWLRRRVRLGYWKQWKRPRTRRRHLLALGISRDDVKLATRSRKGYWRMAGNSIVQQALTKQCLWNQSVSNMRQQWIDLHYGAQAP